MDDGCNCAQVLRKAQAQILKLKKELEEYLNK